MAVPTGTVTITEGGNVLATISLNPIFGNGSAPITFATAGTHTLVANYSGDSNNGPASSVPLDVQINAALTPAVVTISATPNPGAVGSAVTISVSVTPGP